MQIKRLNHSKLDTIIIYLLLIVRSLEIHKNFSDSPNINSIVTIVEEAPTLISTSKRLFTSIKSIRINHNHVI